MALPKSVTVCECWARDGLQSIPKVIPTADKIEMIDRILDSGVKKLEVTSFSHPKLLPQFADCVEVMKGISRRKGVSYVVLMPNLKGFERLEVCQKEGYGCDEIILMISSSEAHNSVNFRIKHDEAKREHAAIMARARALGIKTIGCAGTVYGCPIDGDVPMAKVLDIVGFYLAEGAETIMLGVRPQIAHDVLTQLRFRSDHKIVSLIATLSLEEIATHVRTLVDEGSYRPRVHTLPIKDGRIADIPDPIAGR